MHILQNEIRHITELLGAIVVQYNFLRPDELYSVRVVHFVLKNKNVSKRLWCSR